MNSYSPPSCKFLTLPRNVLVLPLSTCMPVCGVQHSLSVAVLPYSIVSSWGRDQFRPLCTLNSWHASWHEQTLLSFTDGEDGKNLLLLYYSLSSPFIPTRHLSASLHKEGVSQVPTGLLRAKSKSQLWISISEYSSWPLNPAVLQFLFLTLL